MLHTTVPTAYLFLWQAQVPHSSFIGSRLRLLLVVVGGGGGGAVRLNGA